MIRDVLSRMDLADWPVYALVLFMGVFLVVVARLLRPSLKEHHEHMNRLPLTDGAIHHEEVIDGQAHG